MAVWFKDYDLRDIQKLTVHTMIELLGIELIEKGEDFLKAKMPIDQRTVQPMGILHGGASVALAESLGSIASYMIIDIDKQLCVGHSIQANFIRPGLKGEVTGIAKLIHLGKTTHIWNVDVLNDEGKLLCTCRHTMAILDK
jgi:1,4-dihydroxy-2-naphthoyl-CoA hydrolase